MSLYLCADCAVKERATWPKGHVATFHPGKCHVCGEQKSLCCVTDWNWPKGHKNHQTWSLRD